MRTGTLQIVAGTSRPGRCRYCSAAILWVTTSSQPGRPARTLPFTAPAPPALSVTTNPVTGLRFEMWPVVALHNNTCPKRPRMATASQRVPAPQPTPTPTAEPTLFDDLEGR